VCGHSRRRAAALRVPEARGPRHTRGTLARIHQAGCRKKTPRHRLRRPPFRSLNPQPSTLNRSARRRHRFGAGQAGAVHAPGRDRGILRERGWCAAGLRHRISASQPSTLDSQPLSAGDLWVELALSGARAEATASGARLRLDGSARVLAYSRLRLLIRAPRATNDTVTRPASVVFKLRWERHIGSTRCLGRCATPINDTALRIASAPSGPLTAS
jgi:hypothetical protein